MTLRCADCQGALGMLRITKHLLKLGHIKEPATLHPPRLSGLARSGGEVSSDELAGNPLPQPEASREDGLTPKDRSVRGPRPDGSSRTAYPSGSPSPASRARRRRGTPPAPTPRSAPSAGAL